MKLFEDCEIVRHHLRGNTAVVIVGPCAVSADEAARLLDEFKDSFGDRHTPIYFSADGWQMLNARKARPAAVQAPAPAAAAEVK